MRRRAAWLVLAAAVLVGATSEPPLPTPTGFVTDQAGVIGAPTRARLSGLLEELKAKTGAEIAVVTVDSTQPLDDFTYAMRIADAWRPGRKKDDTGIVFLLAVRDHKLRILTGYGLEGLLPDGLIGEIEDREIVPALKSGRIDDAVWQGAVALARRIAEDRGVTLTGMPPPRASGPPQTPGWAIVLIFLVMLALVLYQARHPSRFRGGYYGGGFGGGGFGGGFGGGGGGFGGGGFGGGGAGRSW